MSGLTSDAKRSLAIQRDRLRQAEAKLIDILEGLEKAGAGGAVIMDVEAAIGSASNAILHINHALPEAP